MLLGILIEPDGENRVAIVPNSVKNYPPPWTSELNLNYPTKDKVITITLLTVVIILMVLIVL